MQRTNLFAAAAMIMAASLSSLAFGQGWESPYVTASGDRGAQFWSWTLPTMEQERDFVYRQIYQSGNRVDRETSGWYDTQGYNRGYLMCRETSYQVNGYGADVFENAVDDILRYRLSGCTFQVY